MTILPGLTSTRKETIAPFIEDLGRRKITALALFPTCLNPVERQNLYDDLEKIPGLTVPHVHIRSDFDEGELEFLADRFSTEVFNAHPAASAYPLRGFPDRFRNRLFLENVESIPGVQELEDCGGLCLDYSHWQSARLLNWPGYGNLETLVQRFPIGCCHLSAVRPGEWNWCRTGWDHHFFRQLADLDYLAGYKAHLPRRWLSLELENSLADQLEARTYLEHLLLGT